MDINQALRDIDEGTWEGGEFPAIERSAILIADAQSTSNRLSKYALDLWDLGWSDGVAGQPAGDNLTLIRRFASLRRRRRLFKLRTDLDNAEIAKTGAEEAAREAQAATKRCETKLNDLVARREQKPHEFSPLSGITFLLVSIILMLSDIPLTIQFVGQALGMDVSKDIYDAVAGGSRKLHIVNIIFGPFRREAAETLWEVAVIALGIAMLGMFFKLTADFLLGDSHFFTRYRWLVHVRPALQAIFFVVAFSLVCLTLWDMGALRAAASAAALKGTQPPQDLVDTTYKLLAIVLPAIGGICFSLGQKRLQNWWELLVTRTLIVRSRRVVLLATRRAGVEAAASISLIDAIKRESAEEAETTSVPEKVYKHAHERGSRSFERPDSQSLHDRCMALVYRAIAAGVR